MDKMMKVAVMHSPMDIQLERRPVPECGKNEVLVKLEYVGICGSDLHFYEHGHIGECRVSYPFVLGHEPGGTVVQVGTNVKGLKVGDRVCLEPGKTCGHCEFCKSGKYNLCPDVQFFATPPYDGVFQEYVAHPEELCFKLPENVSTMEGALIEPLAVGFHAAGQAGAHVGQVAVVMGAGCIGLVTLMALKAYGVQKVISVDIVENRLNKAREIGAWQVVNGAKENVVERIRALTGGMGADVIVETAGTEITTNQAMHAAKRGGTIVLVGYSASGKVTIPSGLALDKELIIKTVFRYRNIYPMAIEAVSSGVVDIGKIVTNVFELDDIQQAMTACVRDKQNIVKAVVHIG